MQPLYFQMLSDADQTRYAALQRRFSENRTDARKGERFDAFKDRLIMIQNFVQSGDFDDWKRSLVCGIFFFRGFLVVNIQQLRILLGKCKSLINGSLQQLGYCSETGTCALHEEFLSQFPPNMAHKVDMKKWSTRKQMHDEAAAPVLFQTKPFIVPLPVPLGVDVETEAVDSIVRRPFPCPVKCRYKYLDIIQISVSIQTEA